MYNVYLYIQINQGEYSTCATEQFRISMDDSDDILTRGRFYCGKGHISHTSGSNTCTFGKLQLLNKKDVEFCLEKNFSNGKCKIKYFL